MRIDDLPFFFALDFELFDLLVLFGALDFGLLLALDCGDAFVEFS
jgi:hypothetical protein